MPRPDMEFSAVYDGTTDFNRCTGILRVGTFVLVKSEALEGEAAEATKQGVRDSLAGEMIEWIKEYAPEVWAGLEEGNDD